MSHQNLITEFTELYMEKLFYFCLKRTGCSDEAQNLAQDIALNILTALHNGIVPGHFSAWVWQIARNRYSVWAEKNADTRKLWQPPISVISIYPITPLQSLMN